jgi:hypothetical protein
MDMLFIIRLFTALILAAPICYGFLYYYTNTVLDDATTENITYSVLGEHNLKELPPAGSDLALQVTKEINDRTAEFIEDRARKDGASGKTLLLIAPGLVIGFLLAFSGILPWCKEPEQRANYI